jgi:hypothetical protein
LTYIDSQPPYFTEASVYNGTTSTTIKVSGAFNTNAHAINTAGSVLP